MTTKPLDFSKDLTTHCSVTIRASVVTDVDAIVKAQKKSQPKISNKINRSSVMSILIAEALEARKNGS